MSGTTGSDTPSPEHVREAQAALHEIPETVWALARVAADWQFAVSHENRGLASASGWASAATDRNESRFLEASKHLSRRDLATMLLVLRALREHLL